MNAKTSVPIICVEAIMYLSLYNLHDCTFNFIARYKSWTLCITIKLFILLLIFHLLLVLYCFNSLLFHFFALVSFLGDFFVIFCSSFLFHCVYTLYRFSFFIDFFACLFFLALHCIFIFHPLFLSFLLFLLFVRQVKKLIQRSKR